MSLSTSRRRLRPAKSICSAWCQQRRRSYIVAMPAAAAAAAEIVLQQLVLAATWLAGDSWAAMHLTDGVQYRDATRREWVSESKRWPLDSPTDWPLSSPWRHCSPSHASLFRRSVILLHIYLLTIVRVGAWLCRIILTTHDCIQCFNVIVVIWTLIVFFRETLILSHSKTAVCNCACCKYRKLHKSACFCIIFRFYSRFSQTERADCENDLDSFPELFD